MNDEDTVQLAEQVSWLWGWPAGPGLKQVGICFDGKEGADVVFTLSEEHLAQLGAVIFDEPQRLRAKLEALQAEVDELRTLFDLQWTRMQAASAVWRKEAPEQRAGVTPDLGTLLEWLLRRAEATQGDVQ